MGCTGAASGVGGNPPAPTPTGSAGPRLRPDPRGGEASRHPAWPRPPTDTRPAPRSGRGRRGARRRGRAGRAFAGPSARTQSAGPAPTAGGCRESGVEGRGWAPAPQHGLAHRRDVREGGPLHGPGAAGFQNPERPQPRGPGHTHCAPAPPAGQRARGDGARGGARAALLTWGPRPGVAAGRLPHLARRASRSRAARARAAPRPPAPAPAAPVPRRAARAAVARARAESSARSLQSGEPGPALAASRLPPPFAASCCHLEPLLPPPGGRLGKDRPPFTPGPAPGKDERPMVGTMQYMGGRRQGGQEGGQSGRGWPGLVRQEIR